MENPRITLYGKILDNKDGSVLLNYREWKNDQIWYYGNVNGFRGGESQYVVEFDIWNNEPAFNGLTAREAVSDAENIQFSVWDDSTLTSSVNLSYGGTGFVNVRCITKDLKSTFQPIAGPNFFNELHGNVGVDKGILSGQMGGDHSVIQTKIVIPDVVASNSEPLTEQDVNFTYVLSYEYE